MITRAASLCLLAVLTGCATAPVTQSGFLSDYGRLAVDDSGVRSDAKRFVDAPAMAGATALFLEPASLAPGARLAEGLSPEDVTRVTSELDRQLCFALSDRFALAEVPAPDAARVRVGLTGVQRTSAASSVASAAMSRAIPGPGSIRLPIGRGGLTVEMEVLSPQPEARQIAALSWSRGAGVAMDSGSLSPIGDAHRFAGAFADAAADLLGEGRPKRPEDAGPDPCARFGPRLDVGRRVARAALGLHVVGDGPAPPPQE
jgi:hypothetical protein